MFETMELQDTKKKRSNKVAHEPIEELVPPKPEYGFIKLPQTSLHYVKCGQGPPLIIVPATISRIDNWLPLAQFMGQRFTSFFFELPGHGNSTPFAGPFTTERVAETVEALINQLGFKRVSLMGFSFGGILAMKALYRLQDRVERMILLAPALSHRALSFSGVNKAIFRWLIRVIRMRPIQRLFLFSIHDLRTSPFIARLVRMVAKVEPTVPLRKVFRKINAATCEVLTYQMDEMLNLELPTFERPFKQPCYFTMSVLDPMLNYETTLETINQQFENVYVEPLYLPYHQPPERPSFAQLNEHFGPFLMNGIVFRHANESE